MMKLSVLRTDLGEASRRSYALLENVANWELGEHNGALIIVFANGGVIVYPAGEWFRVEELKG